MADLQQITVSTGDILTFGREQKSYRIIYITPGQIEMCQMNTGKLIFKHVDPDVLRQQILDNAVILEYPSHVVIDKAAMSQTWLEKYNTNKQIMREITDVYGPSYTELARRTEKPAIDEICKKYHISKSTLRRLYIRYLQSGLDDSALSDYRDTTVHSQNRKQYKYKKRPGRKSEDDLTSKIVISKSTREHFDAAITERKSGRHKTYDSAYRWMINTYYSETYVENGELFIRQKSETAIPTLRQFTNYARKHVTKLEIDTVTTSSREVRNNERILYSDSFRDALGPGDLAELDALEADVSLVSMHNRTIAIGRPIMYLLIDIYTRMILAMSIGLHNNSYLALSNLFLNLCDDKMEYAARYGHIIKPGIWLSNIIPRRIRVDRGADMKSKAMGHFCEEVGIDRQLVTAATGSLKGSIEQEFRTMHAAQKPHLDNAGVITKRVDSRHHEKAVMTIEEFTKLALDFVLYHNISADENYPLNADMIAHHVHPVPQELWAYGASKYGAPRPITNVEDFRYALLLEQSGSLSRNGLVVNGLSYLNREDPDMLRMMSELQNKRQKFPVRIDPRDVGHVYYLKDGRLMMAALNPGKSQNVGFEQMTLTEYAELKKTKKKLDKDSRVRNERAKNQMYASQEAIVQEAVSRNPSGKGPNDTKHMREHREREKQEVAYDNRLASRIEAENVATAADKLPENDIIDISTSDIQEQPADNQSASSEQKPRTTSLDDFMSAMDDFSEE